ncbi:scytalone dehydratase-inhibitor complex [Corynespora cassiicola Philippines]|uniref:Scytalone dehydratase-inhibitor complex n=1 Tax=Corynespora cassiicola Philippines TaxID=1448308 RepID=A0A2T2NKL9_CORCC|nr:scytalone dehydratase-inhibitor complex [Corynespora cassiicola Philippines]
MASDITFEEYMALSRITFEWADSYDSKQFDRLAAILAPEVTLDYSEAFGQKPITMSKESFLKLSDNPNRLGGIVDCIHHIGGSKYDRTGPDTVTGYHQVRTEYKRYKTVEKKEVEATGQGLTLMHHYYKKVDGKWKLAGTKPGRRMNDFNFDEIFAEGNPKSKI